jgi:eukaryotic-like serine/threonine-protein kinase
MSLAQGIPPAAPDARVEVPTRIGNYEIMGILGRGESATIYLGRELFPQRDVAIKVYDPQRLSSNERRVFQSLFLKETLLARKLTHANITQVYDAAADDTRAYIVMEYAKEGSLERYCTAEGLLPAERVAHLVESCCDALSYAHASGVIHRDLKPANILLSADGEAKVSDFGVAFSNLAFDSTRAM